MTKVVHRALGRVAGIVRAAVAEMVVILRTIEPTAEEKEVMCAMSETVVRAEESCAAPHTCLTVFAGHIVTLAVEMIWRRAGYVRAAHCCILPLPYFGRLFAPILARLLDFF